MYIPTCFKLNFDLEIALSEFVDENKIVDAVLRRPTATILFSASC